jgi:site-specific DNA-methyltransferase (adenine-specific)
MPARSVWNGYGDSGSAARFFYCAKATRKDRNEGLEDPGPQFKHGTTLRKVENTETKGNNHPTVKPTELMKWLCGLVTPVGGIVLDPFMGSGSTGKAAILEGFRFIGIERETEYAEISIKRIQAVHDSKQK